MKLYAKTTSERASKGQGGNEYLEIDLTYIDKLNPKYYVRMWIDKNNNFQFELLDNEERLLFNEETKGEKL